MLDSIHEFFDRNFSSPDANQSKHTIELATAALLIEVSRADGEISADERTAMTRALHTKFHLTQTEAAALIAMAEEQVLAATDAFQFTSLVNKRFTRDQKTHVVELMWQVAYADGSRDLFEDHVIRKLADLLYVDHSDYIAAKLKARNAAKQLGSRS